MINFQYEITFGEFRFFQEEHIFIYTFLIVCILLKDYKYSHQYHI